MDQPEVSVVIPTRNRWQTLTTLALPSATRQAGVQHEIIVVDDASEDRPDDLQGTEIEKSGARLVGLERHGGVARARNAGIARARGKWVALLDEDDVWAPDKLQQVVGRAEEEGADFAYSAVLLVDGARRPRLTVKAVSPGALQEQVMRS